MNLERQRPYVQQQNWWEIQGENAHLVRQRPYSTNPMLNRRMVGIPKRKMRIQSASDHLLNKPMFNNPMFNSSIDQNSEAKIWIYSASDPLFNKPYVQQPFVQQSKWLEFRGETNMFWTISTPCRPSVKKLSKNDMFWTISTPGRPSGQKLSKTKCF